MLAAKRSLEISGGFGRTAHVLSVGKESDVLLTDGSRARTAVSCLLRPEPRDLVALFDIDNGQSFILAVLERADIECATVEVPGASGIRVRSRHLELLASEDVAIRSLRDLELASAAGAVNVSARNITVSALESFIQCARDCLVNLGAYALQVRGLLRIQGQNAILTAHKDMKLDGERVSVG